MDASPVFGLGYVRIWEADLAQWRQFAEGGTGMMAEHDGEGRLLVRMDDWVGRFIVEEGRAALPRTPGGAERGHRLGMPERGGLGEGAPGDRGRRDPYAGRSGPTAWCRDWFGLHGPQWLPVRVLLWRQAGSGLAFVSPRGVTFVTGEQGMGHVLLFAGEPAKSLDFYSRVLGFGVREAKTADDGTVQAVFLGPNQREHSLALLGIGDASRLGHVLIEVSDVDAVGRAMDRCLDGLAPMTVSIGRHWNDQMISFYLRTPSGFDIEYGFGGRKVATEHWSRGESGGSGLMSTWGHRRIGPDGRPGLPLGR